jgi:hypothetical protein
MPKMICLGAAVAALAIAPASAKDGAWLQKQIAQAKSGAVIVIPAGDYDLTDVKISRSITLKGDGAVTLRSASVTEKGILTPLAGVDLTLENLTFHGARSWDRNGAGVRHEGRNLTIVNCRFISNEDGILATGDEAGAIVIRNSKFVDNGFGDGQSHAIYVSSGRRIEVEGSTFEGTRIGHHLKSLAGETIVRDVVFDDARGRGSYAIDASKGGALSVENATFIQAADGENQAIVNYDLSRGGVAASVRFVNPKIINAYEGAVFLRNDTKTAPVIIGAAIDNRARLPLRMVSLGSPKPMTK